MHEKCPFLNKNHKNSFLIGRPKQDLTVIKSSFAAVSLIRIWMTVRPISKT
jgi:hypothetical protein